MDYNFIQKIISFYPFEVEKVTPIKNKSGRETFELKTNEGEKIVKSFKMPPKKIRFLGEAHLHLQNNGLPIVPIHLTRNNGIGVGADEIFCLMYDKKIGKEITYYHIGQMEKLIEFMAKFHVASIGYKVSDESKKRTRLGKWHKLYRWKLQELRGYKQIAQSLVHDEFSQLFLQYIDKFLSRGEVALRELDTSCYEMWTKEVMELGQFCQQDFTVARFTEIDGEIYMKELHSITYDLPIRDIRILINKIMKKLSTCDDLLIIQLLKAYQSVSPLTKEQYRLLWIDLAFPHQFCAVAHKYFLQQKKSWSDEKYMWMLQNIIQVENSKDYMLNHFQEMYDLLKEGVGENGKRE